MLNFIMQSVITPCVVMLNGAMCCYAEFHYAECRGANGDGRDRSNHFHFWSSSPQLNHVFHNNNRFESIQAFPFSKNMQLERLGKVSLSWVGSG